MHPDISKWTVGDVSEWLIAKGFQGMVKFFVDNEMNGQTLLNLDTMTLFQLCPLNPQIFKVGPLIEFRAELEILRGEKVEPPATLGGFQLRGVDARQFFAPDRQLQERASSPIDPSIQNNNIAEIGSIARQQSNGDTNDFGQSSRPIIAATNGFGGGGGFGEGAAVAHQQHATPQNGGDFWPIRHEPMGEEQQHQGRGDEAVRGPNNIVASREDENIDGGFCGECQVDSAVDENRVGNRSVSVNDSADVEDWSHVPLTTRGNGNNVDMIAPQPTPISDVNSFHSEELSVNSNGSAAAAVDSRLSDGGAPSIVDDDTNQMAAAAPNVSPMEMTTKPIDLSGARSKPSTSLTPSPPQSAGSTQWQQQQGASIQQADMRMPMQRSMAAAVAGASISTKSQAIANNASKSTPQTRAAAYNPILTRNRPAGTSQTGSARSLVSNQGSTAPQHGGSDDSAHGPQQQQQQHQQQYQQQRPSSQSARSQLNQGGYMYAYPGTMISPVPKLDEIFRAYVCLAESPLRLGILSQASMERVQRMEKEMNEFYNTDPHVLPLSAADRLQIGAACAAKFDNIWYRASVDEILDNGRVRILFVDYGNTEIVPRNALMALRHSKLIECPPQRIDARMAGLREDMEIPLEIKNEFFEMVDPCHKIFLMEIESYEGKYWPIALTDAVTNHSINYQLSCKLGLQQTKSNAPPQAMMVRLPAAVSKEREIWDDMMDDDGGEDYKG